MTTNQKTKCLLMYTLLKIYWKISHERASVSRGLFAVGGGRCVVVCPHKLCATTQSKFKIELS